MRVRVRERVAVHVAHVEELEGPNLHLLWLHLLMATLTKALTWHMLRNSKA